MSFGIIPAGYSILIWAPLLALFSGLLIVLAAMIVADRRPRAVRDSGSSMAPWSAPGLRLAPVGLAAAGTLAVAGLLLFGP